MSAELKYQDHARWHQKELLETMFGAMDGAEERGEKTAYLFISGNVAEILRPFGFHLVYPEVTSLQCAIKKAAGENILAAEDMGYSSDVCAYVKNDIGLLGKDLITPMGKLPKPDLLVLNYAGCTTYLKWFEQLANYFDAEMVVLDVPYLSEDEPSEADLQYTVDQLKDLIQVCERMTGIKWDEAACSEMLKKTVNMEEDWSAILHSAKNSPSPFDGYFEAVFFMSPLYLLRGTEGGEKFYREARLEIEERLAHGISPVGDEKLRVVVEGPPPWPHFRSFWDMFKRWGVTAVASTYAKVGGIFDLGFRHDPERPLESMAEYCMNCYTNWHWGKRRDLIRGYVNDYNADGVVVHSVKSCRSFSVGQADMREHFIQDLGIPTLFVESDLCDPRYFQKAQMQNRMDAFFEALQHKKLMAAS